MVKMMNLLMFISIFSQFGCKSLASYSAVKNPPVPPKGYTLMWADEFNIDGKPDSENWSYESGFKRNNELQWYQSQNANIKDGILEIESKRESVKNDNYDPASGDWRKNREFAEYTSSSINTRNKKHFQYGIVEVRAKIDIAMGMWPAIWTLGISKAWPANGEVDLMEYYLVKEEPTILANAAWENQNRGPEWDGVHVPFSDFLKKDPDWVNKYHIWKMEWTKDYIKLHLDGELLNEVDLSKTINPDGFNPFQQPHYLLLNLAIGGNGGDPSFTKFPRKYLVDYVRIYQKE